MIEASRYRYRFTAPKLLLRTLVHALDYDGRSTRTEVILWLVAWQVIGTALLVDRFPELLSTIAVTSFFLIPFVALFARRLNDQGRTKWWLLLLPLGLFDEATGLVSDGPLLPAWINVLLNLTAFAGVFGLLFLEEGASGDNRFGPNPREVSTP